MSASRARGAAPRKVAQERAARSAPKSRARAAAPSPAESAHDYETVALVLQGGGALGSYQCGVYEAMHEGGIRPNWFAGTSIGAINAAILAGNAPERRIEQLRAFWDFICTPSGVLGPVADVTRSAFSQWPPTGTLDAWANVLGAIGALVQGQRGFFNLRVQTPFLFADGSAKATSFYDTGALKATLERFIDFERIRSDSSVRLSVGATHVATGNFRYFDSTRDPIGPEHVMASGALPPAFPAVAVRDGETGRDEFYWDGGIVSNTPLDHVLGSTPRRDSLLFQVDLWSARGDLPQTMMDVFERQKEIQFSSRTRYGTDTVARVQALRNAIGELLRQVPADQVSPELMQALEPWVCDRVFNIVHLIYRSKPYEQQFKDYAFGVAIMREHWAAGLADMHASLQHPEFFTRPSPDVGVVTHDIHRSRAEPRT